MISLSDDDKKLCFAKKWTPLLMVLALYCPDTL